MPEGFEKVTHCLFDMDGLLLNTEEIYTVITQQILEEQGCKEKYTGDVKVTLMGGQSMEVANAIIKRYVLSLTPEKFIERQRQLAADLMPSVELLPGVERLLRHLASHNVPIALATSSSKEMYDLKTVRHTKLFELFNHKVYGSSDPEVEHGKPAPDIFIVAARRFPDQPDPSKCLVFEVKFILANLKKK